MKEGIKNLIERLSDKSLTLGCIFQRRKPLQRTLGLGTRFYHRFVLNRKIHKVHGGSHYESYQLVSCEKDYGEHVSTETFSDIIYEDDYEKTYKNLGHPILIGDVLRLASIAWTEDQQKDQWLQLVQLWFECGVEKSLQFIFESAEWVELETIITPKDPKKMWDGQKRYSKLVPKQPAIRELFEFLIQLGL